MSGPDTKQWAMDVLPKVLSLPGRDNHPLSDAIWRPYKKNEVFAYLKQLPEYLRMIITEGIWPVGEFTSNSWYKNLCKLTEPNAAVANFISSYSEIKRAMEYGIITGNDLYELYNGKKIMIIDANPQLASVTLLLPHKFGGRQLDTAQRMPIRNMKLQQLSSNNNNKNNWDAVNRGTVWHNLANITDVQFPQFSLSNPFSKDNFSQAYARRYNFSPLFLDCDSRFFQGSIPYEDIEMPPSADKSKLNKKLPLECLIIVTSISMLHQPKGNQNWSVLVVYGVDRVFKAESLSVIKRFPVYV